MRRIALALNLNRGGCGLDLDEVGRGYLLEPCDAHAVERLGDGDVWLIAVSAPAPYQCFSLGD